MEIELDLNKTLEQNADDYFNKAKKIRKKIERTKHVINQFETKHIKLEKKQTKEQEKEKQKKKEKPRKKEWFEKFRWFISSEGFLCIGGRDATTNEIVIKKHTDKEDFVAHTEMPGSPFFVIKTEGKQPGDITKEELATATASYSKAWKLGLAYAEVMIVKGEQVKKDISLPKGTFMVHGKREKFNPALELGVGELKDGKIMGAAISACEKHCKDFVVVKQGKGKKSDIAKKIEKKLGLKDRLDDITRVLPSGGIDISRQKK